MAVLGRVRGGTVVIGLVAIAAVNLDLSCSPISLGGPDPLVLVGVRPDCYDRDKINNEEIAPPDPTATRQYLFTRFSRTPTSVERRKIESDSSYRTRILDSHGSNSYTVSILTDGFGPNLKRLQNGTPNAECIGKLARSNRSSAQFKGRREDLRGYDLNVGGTPAGALITVYVRFFDNVPIAEQRQILTGYGVLNVGQLESFNDQWRVTLPDDNVDNLTDDRQVQWVEELEQEPTDDMDDARPAIDLPNNYPNGGDGTVIAQWEICHPANGAPDEHPDLANRASLGFASRICNASPTAGPLPDNDHATQVAGIMIGDGSAGDSAGQLRGIAPQSQLVSYSVADQDGYGFISEYLDAARHGAIVSSNSWGPTADDYYHRTLSHEYPFRSAFFDMISSLRNSGGWPAGPGHRILIVASSGNRGDDKADPSNANSDRIYWRTTRVRNAAKNVLTVGNVASGQGDAVGWPAFDTGRGPTRDGRIKPDLVAPGSEIKNGADMADKGINAPVYPTGIVQPKPQDYYDSSWGTSFSTPIVSGAAALLATTIREGTCNRNPTPAELRALLINTAKDLINASKEARPSGPILNAQNNDSVLNSPPVGVDALLGPDYVFGYGMVQPASADAYAQKGHFLRGSIDRGFIEYPIRVGQANLENNERLRVTLVWDDPPFAYNSLPDPDTGLLQNDLDLVLIGPYGRRYYPWKLDPENPAAAATQTSRSRLFPWPGDAGDHRNTVEQISIEPDKDQLGKTWYLRVYGSTMRLPAQEFVLASSIINPAVPCGTIASRVVLKPITPPTTRVFWVLFIIALIMLLLLLLSLAEEIYDAYEQRGNKVAISRIIQVYVGLLLVAAALFYWSDALMDIL